MNFNFSVIYFKFAEVIERGAEDLADCIGSLKLDSCPTVFIKFNRVEGIDLFDGDCTGRM